MSQLQIKEVNFFNDTLIAVQDTAAKKIFVGVKWICQGLGLDARRQREKLQQHLTLSKGVATLPLPSNGGLQDTLVIEIDYLPLWLATINPTLVGGNTSQQKLIEYQLKAKDVLAAAFIQNNNNLIPLDERKVRMELLKTALDHDVRIENVEKKLQEVEQKVDEQITLDHGEQRKLQKAVAKRVYEFTNDTEYRSELFRQVYREIKDRWAVASYRDVRRTELAQVLKYIDAWVPKAA